MSEVLLVGGLVVLALYLAYKYGGNDEQIDNYKRREANAKRVKDARRKLTNPAMRKRLRDIFRKKD